jgi:hypothetical protein
MFVLLALQILKIFTQIFLALEFPSGWGNGFEHRRKIGIRTASIVFDFLENSFLK